LLKVQKTEQKKQSGTLMEKINKNGMAFHH